MAPTGEVLIFTATDDLLANVETHARGFDQGDLPRLPELGVAVVACMDARLNIYRLLGTREIILIHHTDCGMLTFTDDEFKAQIAADTGIRPPWAAEAFDDLDEDVRQSIARIRSSPFIPHTDAVRGFVYSVRDGSLTEVK
ncbi:carbonic anhydrase [Parafrankia sp. EAN1pec]|uniref:beta-class carbonic anhydrase n=1 Tax=Parafrankia sp. (strain EAN1pec) TaxID=298653 RepID=UPI0003156159